MPEKKFIAVADLRFCGQCLALKSFDQSFCVSLASEQPCLGVAQPQVSPRPWFQVHCVTYQTGSHYAPSQQDADRAEMSTISDCPNED
jgi:hypothetical protein